MFAEEEQEYQHSIAKAKRLIESREEAKVVEMFELQANMFCFSQTPPHFQGVALSTSFHEQANHLLKHYVKYEQSACVVIKKVLPNLS